MAQKIEMGKKYRTRDGREVRVLSVDLKGDDPVVAAVTSSAESAQEYLLTFQSNGRYHPDIRQSHNDLIEVKSEIKGFVNIYRSGSGGVVVGSQLHPTLEEARTVLKRARIGVLATIPINAHEGDGLACEFHAPNSKNLGKCDNCGEV